MPRENARMKAARLLLGGAVSVLEVTQHRCTATVKGDTATHAVTFDGSRWACDCAADGPCSHAQAVARVVAMHAEGRPFLPVAIPRELPARTPAIFWDRAISSQGRGERALSGNREKKPAGEKLPLGRTGSEGSDQMSFEDRVKARLKLWIERNPGAPKDAVDRKARSIARRLREELQEAEDVTSASDRRMSQ